MTIKLWENYEGGIVINVPAASVPAPADFVVNFGDAEACGEALTPVVSGFGLVEHRILDFAPAVVAELGMCPVVAIKCSEVGGRGIEAGTSGVGEAKGINEAFDASVTGGIGAHGVGTAVVGFTDHEIETGGESERALVAGGDEGFGALI